MKTVKIIMIILGLLFFSWLLRMGYIMFISGQYVKVRGQELNSYQHSVGGDMRGSSHTTTIERYDNKNALLTIEKKQWYGQIAEVREYFVAASVLDDIQRVFLQQRMNFWNRKRFTRMFICDGASKSYCFIFNSSIVSFSSQYYPKRYAQKLAKIDDVIRPCTKDLTQLPGLVLPKMDVKDNESEYSKYIPNSQAVGIYVHQYSNNILYYKLVNDTDTEVDNSAQPIVKCLENDSIIHTTTNQPIAKVFPKSEGDGSIKLDDRLNIGTYELKLGDYACTFEISELLNE